MFRTSLKIRPEIFRAASKSRSIRKLPSAAPSVCQETAVSRMTNDRLLIQPIPARPESVPESVRLESVRPESARSAMLHRAG